MTLEAITGIGFCARTLPAGNRAFEFALGLARRHDVRLNIFFFPTPPTRAHLPRGRRGELLRMSEEEKIELEREVRLYYDALLGDFINVGFRLCEGDEDPELRRCLLIRRDYNVLVLPYDARRRRFGHRTIEEFAEAMVCPTVLVGSRPSSRPRINTRASCWPWPERLGLAPDAWRPCVPVAPER